VFPNPFFSSEISPFMSNIPYFSSFEIGSALGFNCELGLSWLRLIGSLCPIILFGINLFMF
jgi:hypothetical protein